MVCVMSLRLLGSFTYSVLHGVGFNSFFYLLLSSLLSSFTYSLVITENVVLSLFVFVSYWCICSIFFPDWRRLGRWCCCVHVVVAVARWDPTASIRNPEYLMPRWWANRFRQCQWIIDLFFDLVKGDGCLPSTISEHCLYQLDPRIIPHVCGAWPFWSGEVRKWHPLNKYIPISEHYLYP